MKVLAFNGSPKAKGNTHMALDLVANELRAEGIEVEMVHVGNKNIRGCISCYGCVKNKDEKCVLPDDGVNDYIQLMKEADGILLGSPVYYAGVAGTMKSFLDRVFFVIGANGNFLRHKVGASVAAVRRSGGIPTIDNLDRYINYSEMIVPTSSYWNVIHGMTPGQVNEDTEGLQITRTLGKNMAWIMKVIEASKDTIPAPEGEKKILTNFVR